MRKTISVSESAHKLLRAQAFKEEKSIFALIDELLKIKKNKNVRNKSEEK